MPKNNNNQWHSLSLEEVYKEVDFKEEGLSAKEAKERLEKHGKNEIQKEEGETLLQLIFKEINSPLIYLLIAAAAISIFTAHYIDAGVIIAVVILNTAMGVWQEYRAEKAISALQKLSAPKAVVKREGKTEEIDSSEVVPGDLIIIKTGDKIPADARLINSEDLEVNESALTGESEPVEKFTGDVDQDTPIAERTNMVWMSTPATQGKGEAVVVSTGMDTETGQIAVKVGETKRELTPLQKKLDRLGKYIGAAAVLLAGIIFLTGYLKGYETVEMLLYSVAAAVSAIPEGLPAVISITLALGVKRMASKNAIIRRLPAVETLGSTTIICSDKTGTITKNEMTVIKVFSGGKKYDLTGKGYEPEGEIKAEGGEDVNEFSESLKKLFTIGALTNDAELKKDDEGNWGIEGTPTDGAIYTASYKADFKREDLSKEKKRMSEIPFSSKINYMATLNKGENKNLLLVKGAPETILDFCTKYLEDDEVKELSNSKKEELNKINDEFADQALRVIAGAYKEINKDELKHKDAEGELIFTGFWGIIDPPREEAVEAIEQCKQAGIKVILMTGDNALTAAAIAEKVKITEGRKEAVTGKDIESMSDDEMGEKLKNVQVFARVSPSHKLKILNTLKKQHEIVAMTGDGVNDAPSLKAADIGVAMGVAGTDVAKEAADMILTDDNFAAIVKAIEEGRLIFNNLRHVVFFLITTNLGEILLLISALLLNLPLPLTAVMILWVNLVTDGPSDIAIGVEPKQRTLLKDKPRPPDEGILNKAIIMRMLLLAPVMAAGTLYLYWYELQINDTEKAKTIAFTTLAAFQWFNAFNARSHRFSVFQIGVFTNKWVVIAVSGAVILQLGAIYTAFGQKIFSTVPLNFVDWGWILLISSSIFIVDEARKFILRKRKEK